MKILFALRSRGFFRFFDGTIQELCAEGHTVEVVCHFNRRPDPNTMNSADLASLQALLRCEAELSGFCWGPALGRQGPWRRPLFAARRLRDYTSYLMPGRQSSQMVVERSERYLAARVQRVMRFRLVRGLLLTRAAQQALRWFERLAPPDRCILDWLRRHRPDIVVASPVLMIGSDEVEYVKAAAALGIPTAVVVMSWDNLTTKGLLQVIPDMTLVWNKAQVEEAIGFHHVPRDQAVLTGAPVFDAWFSMRPTLDRASFCWQAGLDPDKPYVLYLCSSWSIAQDETTYVQDVALGLRRFPGTRHLNLLVRPHPSNAKIWENYTGDLLSIWPPRGDMPSTPQARQDFYHSLYYSAGVLGINTSGLIEAAIVDRPCITILAERYRDTQQEISHFKHLLNADFLEVASDIPAAAEILARLLRGEDTRRDLRSRFVQEFVRPWGLNRPSSRIMARVIEAIGQRRSLEELTAMLAPEGDTAAALTASLPPVVAKAASA